MALGAGFMTFLNGGLTRTSPHQPRYALRIYDQSPDEGGSARATKDYSVGQLVIRSGFQLQMNHAIEITATGNWSPVGSFAIMINVEGGSPASSGSELFFGPVTGATTVLTNNILRFNSVTATFS